MTEKKTRLKPTRKASKDLKGWAKRARQFHDKLAAEGRHFGDSAEIIRADRDSRV
jgi:hypothetical protein